MKIHISWSGRQWLEFVSVFIVATVLVWFGFYKYHLFGGPVASYQIVGQVTEVSIKDSDIKISVISIQKDGSVTPETSSQKDATILVDANTKFIKTILHRPSKDVLAKTNGVWDMKSVTTEIISTKLSDLANGNSVLVKTSTNNPTGTSFTASEIDYFTVVD